MVKQRGAIPVSDYYYYILSEAVASLNPNTAQTRAALFVRARNTLLSQIRDHRPRWTEGGIQAELADFERAIARIELELARQPADISPVRQRRR